MPATIGTLVIIVYAVIGGGAHEMIGQELRPGAEVPAEVTGLLIGESGVVQLSESARARVAEGGGAVALSEGSIRVVAERSLSVELDELRVGVGEGSTVVISRWDEELEVCVLRGRGAIAGRGDGRSDSETVAVVVPDGRCWTGRVGTVPEERLSPAVAGQGQGLRERAEHGSVHLIELLSVDAGAPEQLEQVERGLESELSRGPRREASSCGCSEGGGGGGSLDPGGGGSGPEPERPDPGRLRIRLRIPSR